MSLQDLGQWGWLSSALQLSSVPSVRTNLARDGKGLMYRWIWNIVKEHPVECGALALLPSNQTLSSNLDFRARKFKVPTELEYSSNWDT